MFGDRGRRRRVREAARTLWRDLCQAHGLTLAERRLLKRAACDMGFPYPAVVFFRPSMVGGYLKEHRDALSSQRREGLKRLARILFSDRPPAELLDRGPVGDDGLPHRFAPDEVLCV